MNIDTIDFANIKLSDEIGEGTFGKVYKAQWRNKCVAVKRIYLNVNEEYVEREFKQLSRANHINIIFLHGISIHEDIHYLIMEYADGGSLFNFLHKVPRLEYSLNHVINWALQAAKGAAYLHSMTPHSVIHRDLKPHNMLLHDKRSCLKICDFGTVRYMSSMMTKNSGTAAYMAPEVFNGERYTTKCDVFSWSITMWELQSRKVPYEAISPELAVCQKVDKGLRPPMSQLIFDCPEDIQKLMTDGWQADPNKRPSMNDIIEVLNKYPIDVDQLKL
ncbi:mitogen-activated protein kinase kinase kinase 7 isoform X2 [Drosophila innubila]|uniref:mitogen-activated protein kinase kinase kinase 7 isoform X2 n=1 Tax=Drosophila innubila TaxID=198719 RepID=UPI00148E8613|nr:mitogen-activated protein kinase kinase kinase 7 isoform X2 [Drosophila innubila]